MKIRGFALLFVVACGSVEHEVEVAPDAPLASADPDPGPVLACSVDADCTSAIPNPTGCNLNQCIDHTCVASARHDDASFVGTPLFSNEVDVSAIATTPFKTLWDGTSFLVIYGSPGALTARRVAPDGQILDASPIALPGAYDIAFVNGHYMLVTVEPYNAATAIYAYTMSPAGTVTSAKSVVLWDAGGNCPLDSVPDMTNPKITSDGNRAFIVAGVNCGFIVKGTFASGAAWSPDVSLDRPRNPALAGGAPGFAVVEEELKVGGGHNEAYGQLFDSVGAPTSGYVALSPYSNPGPATVSVIGMAAGATSWLASFNRKPGLLTLRPVTSSGALVGAELDLPTSGYGTYETAAVGFDGKNFLVMPVSNAASLPSYRVTPTGAKLDPVPVPLTPDDAAVESKPTLGSDGAGRYAVAYQKSTDGHVHVRTFSTCP